jgi:hypothetical protein
VSQQCQYPLFSLENVPEKRTDNFLLLGNEAILNIVTEPLLLGGSLKRVFGMTVCTSSCTFVIYLVLFIN